MNNRERVELYRTLTMDERQDFAERASILEYEGGYDRDEANKRALEEIIARRTKDGNEPR